MAIRDKSVGGLGMRSALDGAIEAHVERFGKPPVVAGLEGIGRDRELADLIWVAIRMGKPFDAATTSNAWVVKTETGP